MKILFLTNIPSPYRIEFFNELGKYCELTVLFEKRESDERDDSWKSYRVENFNPVFLRGKKVGVAEAFCPEVIKYLKKRTYDHIIVTNFSDPTGALAIAYMKLRNIPYGIESDGGFACSRKGVKQYVKKWLLSSAYFYFSTAKEHDQYYMAYGAKDNELIRYPFSSLHDSDVLKQPVQEVEKNQLREKLGMSEKKIVLSVGQFIYRKGYDVLFEALTQIDSTVGCYIVGGKPTKEYIDMIEQKNLINVHFIGFKSPKELEEYYKAADIFVLPTREDIWGLVINEAMAKGLPVVTTERCIAGVELIGDSNAGTIVKVEDANGLACAIRNELCSVSHEKSQLVLSIIRNYTVENMAYVHLNELEKYKI